MASPHSAGVKVSPADPVQHTNYQPNKGFIV